MMFSVAEKQKIAEAVESVLLEICHPEMPEEMPVFSLHVVGKEGWSWADILPNWTYEYVEHPIKPNPWNEKARDILNPEDKED